MDAYEAKLHCNGCQLTTSASPECVRTAQCACANMDAVVVMLNPPEVELSCFGLPKYSPSSAQPVRGDWLGMRRLYCGLPELLCRMGMPKYSPTKPHHTCMGCTAACHTSGYTQACPSLAIA